MCVYRRYLLLATALLTGTPALAAEPGAPKARKEPAPARDAGSTGGSQLHTRGGAANRPALPPAMLAALEDLSKKSVAESRPTNSQPPAAPKPAAATAPTKPAQVQTPPRVQPQRNAQPQQNAGYRGRRSAGPTTKLEALRERMQHSRRRGGFRRSA